MTGFLANAESRVDVCLGILADGPEPGDSSLARAYFDLTRKGTRLRLIGEITKERVKEARELMKTVEIRDLAGARSYFAVSDHEYVAVPGREDFNPKGPLLYSNEEAFVRHHQALFDMLWERAVPADVRIEELEKGEEVGTTKITFSTEEIMASARHFVDEMKEEALVIVSREGGLRDNVDLFQRMARRANETGAKVRVMGRFLKEEEELVKKFQAEGFRFRSLAPGRATNLALGIYDRRGMGLVEYRYPGMQRLAAQTYLTGVISTNRQTVEGLATVFDSLWEESELRQEAELMRDIMTHDLRNYNQILVSNAELLKEEAHANPKTRKFVEAILGAVEGTVGLIDKTKVLGRVLAEGGPPLAPTDLTASLDRSLQLVETANQDRVVQASRAGPAKAAVVADSLLDQLFVNIFSNALRYTAGKEVPLEVRVQSVDSESEPDGSRGQSYWKVEISDHGQGMPDEMKSNAALRYLGVQTGKGLGLSIARALAVDRYSGRFALKDRVVGDYSQGTTVEIWLPKG